MRTKKRFISLTLANGHTSVIIGPEHIAVAMRLSGENENGKKEEFTRIIPKDITISPESNWLDVVETPEEIIEIL